MGSLRFLDRLQPNVNVVPSRFWFPLGLPCLKVDPMSSEPFALGKRFAVAKLTASLSPRAMLRSRLLVTSGRLFRHVRSKLAPAKIS